jgi:SAM-dependent methyltransferase
MDFNNTKESYRNQIERSIAFTGKNLDYFTEVKADYLKKIVKKELPNISQPKLLDVGCGHGYMHSSLLKSGFDIVGVEVADEVLPMAKALNKDVTYLSYDGETLPFRDATFDVALAVCVMHHIAPNGWTNFVKELSRVLIPGGIAVVFEHNPFNPLTRYVVSTNPIDKYAVLLPANKTRALLRQSGLIDIVSKNILFTPWSAEIFRKLDERLGWCPFGAQYYAYGKVPNL